jgi:hypothetical protein
MHVPSNNRTGRVGSIAAKMEGCGYRSKSTSPSCAMRIALDLAAYLIGALLCHATATASYVHAALYSVTHYHPSASILS